MMFEADFVRFVLAYNAGRPIHKVAFYDRAANQQGRHNGMRAIFAEMAQKFAQAQGWEIVSPTDSTCIIEVGGPGNKQRAVLGQILEQPEVEVTPI